MKLLGITVTLPSNNLREVKKADIAPFVFSMPFCFYKNGVGLVSPVLRVGARTDHRGWSRSEGPENADPGT